MLALAIAVVISALAIAACGSASKPKSSASVRYSKNVKYADCMRSHGVPNFPDPWTAGSRYELPAST